MIILITVFLLWVLYNIWIVIQSAKNSIVVGAVVKTNCIQEQAFEEYLNVKDYYLELSKAHKKYEINGDELLKDAVIEIWEKSGFQLVKHKYKIIELVPNERMKLISEKSDTTVLGVFKSHSRSETEFTFSPLSDISTELCLSINIIFPNKFRHLLARVFFTKLIWQAHANDEMKELAKIIEKRVAINQA